MVEGPLLRRAAPGDAVSGLKVQTSIQGDVVRVTGKSRDELQEAIAVLKAADLPVALQFTNYR